MDDDDLRHRTFKRMTIGLTVQHVHTADQAIQALVSRFAVVFLDHDLADQHYTGVQDERTGLAVARHIADMPTSRQPDVVVIHSLNPDGAANMHEELRGHVKQVIRVPFSSLVFESVVQQLRDQLA